MIYIVAIMPVVSVGLERGCLDNKVIKRARHFQVIAVRSKQSGQENGSVRVHLQSVKPFEHEFKKSLEIVRGWTRDKDVAVTISDSCCNSKSHGGGLLSFDH